MSVRRGLTTGGAALRSALIPGWGQWAARHRARGGALMLITLVLAVGVLLALLALMRGLLPLLSLPPALERVVSLGALVGQLPLTLLDRLLAGDWGVVWRGFIALNVAVALIRTWIAIDAARCVAGGGDRPPLGQPLRSTVASISAFVVLAAPHAAALAAAAYARPLISQVFVTAPASSAAVATPAPGEPALPPEPDPGRPTWDGVSRLNVLLMGVDRRPTETAERGRGNSDTLLVVSIDPGARSAAMISIPRDVYLPIAGIGLEKINAAYREVGPELSVRVVGDLIGQPIHRWASIEVAAFAKTIDALGGVIVDVETPIRDDEYPADNFAIRRIYLPAGLQWLTGEQALWYARSRHGSNDFERAARQQALLLALKDRARDRRTLQMVTPLLQSLADAVQTDLAPREVLALARLGGAADFRSARLVLTPPTFGTEIIRPDLYAILPNVPRIRGAVADALSGAQVAQGSGVLGGPGGAVPAQGGAGAEWAEEEEVYSDPEMDVP